MLRAKHQCFKEAEKLLPHKLHRVLTMCVCYRQMEEEEEEEGKEGREMETSSSRPGLESWHH